MLEYELIEYLDYYMEEEVDTDAIDIDFDVFYEDFLVYLYMEFGVEDPGYMAVFNAFVKYFDELKPGLELKRNAAGVVRVKCRRDED